MKYHKAFGHADHCYILKNLDLGDGKWSTLDGKPPNGVIKKMGEESHLIGVPFVRQGGDTCQVALLDLDDHGGEMGWDGITAAADKLMEACESEGLDPHPFRSSGGKGIHLWFIWDSPQQAAGVRVALRRVLSACGYAPGTGGVIKGEVEIFPKQDRLGAQENGNCACLPFRPLDFTLSDYETRDYKWAMSKQVSAVTVHEVQAVEPCEVTESQLDALLKFVPVEGLGYDEWWQRVMAIKDAGGSKELAEAWSRGDPAYADMTITDAKWSSVRGESGRRVTVRTLMKLAGENGWGGIEADVDEFPVAVSDDGELLLDYERIRGKGRWSGYVSSTIDQVCQCLGEDPRFPFYLSRDEFLQEVLVHDKNTGGFERLRDHHYVKMRRWFDRERWEPVSTGMIREAVDDVANGNTTNMAKAWANALKWDGVDRFDRMLTAYGVGITPYYRAVIEYMWTSHAARTLHPGYQADAIIVFACERQGTGKTQSIVSLAPRINGISTYMNIHIDDLLNSDRAARVLKGCLVANLDEMRNFSKREAAEIKASLSRMREAYVPKYKETREEFGRQCMIYATTNQMQFLDDSSGNRRYHVIQTGDIDNEWIEKNVEQLWAQGVALFKSEGQKWKTALQLAPEQAAKYEVGDVWAGAVWAWVETTPLDSFTTADVLTDALQVPVERHNRAAETRVGAILKSMGCEKKRRRVGGGVLQWVYEKPQNP